MAKNNIRSVRFSDEMMEIINQQIGDNFTQRFERMVYNCYMLLPEKERQAERLDVLIKEKREELNRLQDRYYKGACYIAGCCNGSRPGSEAGNRGSTPLPATIHFFERSVDFRRLLPPL